MRTNQPEPEESAETPEQGRLELVAEGTGEPRPIPPKRELDAAPIDDRSQARAEAAVPIRPQTEAAQIGSVHFEVPAQTEPADERPPAQVSLERMPRHLQMLLEDAGQEVAQSSYSAFRESRAELIQRLLDPPITLEQAARILNVCPTTVRRYTNRGILKHFRTGGNQRRFRLSDVLSFMERYRSTQADRVSPGA